MGMVTTPLQIVPAMHVTSTAASTIDAANEKVAFVFTAPADGNITALEIRVGAITTAKSLRVGLQALDTSGDPDGTFLGAAGAGYGTIATPSASTIYQVSLGAAVTVVAGTSYAAVVKWTDDGDPGNLTITRMLSAAPLMLSYANNGNYTDLYTTAWAKDTGMPLVGILYGTTRYQSVTHPGSTSTSLNVKTSSTPDEVGNRFVMPYGCRAVGAWAYVDADVDIDLVLYSDSGTALATGTLQTENRQATGSLGGFARFVSGGAAAPYTLVAGTAYRICIKPTADTNCTTRYSTFYEAASLGQLELGTNCYRCYRTDGGAFTDDTSSRTVISIVIDQISFPDAGNVQSDDTNTSVTGTLTLPTVGQVQSGVTYGAGGTEYEGTLSAGGGLFTHPGLTGGMRG